MQAPIRSTVYIARRLWLKAQNSVFADCSTRYRFVLRHETFEIRVGWTGQYWKLPRKENTMLSRIIVRFEDPVPL